MPDHPRVEAAAELGAAPAPGNDVAVHETTTAVDVEPWLDRRVTAASASESLVLAIAWSAVEPERTGEVAVFEDGAGARLLGRGGTRPDDPCPRLTFVRRRPWGSEQRGPLEAPGLSRRQLVVEPRAGALAFERVGRVGVRWNGREAAAGLAGPGDTLTVENQLVLLCARRPSPLAVPRSLRRAHGHAFGAPDADGIVGESAAVWSLRDEIAFAAASPAHVLIWGETGAGKELVANAIHRLSARGTQPLLARSAASFPETLIDAELFGNMRDYPNAGMPAREGLIGAANGTSLFLDEIGELALGSQAHLLRVLDGGGQYHRLGEASSRRSDLRLIAATNRPLSALKPDFAARFAVQIAVPSLAARREDIPLLCRHLLSAAARVTPELCARFASAPPGAPPQYRFDPVFVEALLRREYPGNVRDLAQLLWASLRESRGPLLEQPPSLSGIGRSPAPTDAAAVSGGAAVVAPPARREPTAEEIRRVLARHGGNRSKAYVDLGLSSRYALGRLLRKHGIGDDGADEGPP
jgi:two-component system nitrogen regulation response regulator GlnG/two-component system response regulator HydG